MVWKWSWSGHDHGLDMVMVWTWSWSGHDHGLDMVMVWTCSWSLPLFLIWSICFFNLVYFLGGVLVLRCNSKKLLIGILCLFWFLVWCLCWCMCGKVFQIFLCWCLWLDQGMGGSNALITFTSWNHHQDLCWLIIFELCGHIYVIAPAPAVIALIKHHH